MGITAGRRLLCEEEYYLDVLARDFGDYAAEQLEIAIGWGRYAELFAFDDTTGELYLEANGHRLANGALHKG